MLGVPSFHHGRLIWQPTTLWYHFLKTKSEAKWQIIGGVGSGLILQVTSAGKKELSSNVKEYHGQGQTIDLTLTLIFRTIRQEETRRRPASHPLEPIFRESNSLLLANIDNLIWCFYSHNTRDPKAFD